MSQHCMTSEMSIVHQSSPAMTSLLVLDLGTYSCTLLSHLLCQVFASRHMRVIITHGGWSLHHYNQFNITTWRCRRPLQLCGWYRVTGEGITSVLIVSVIFFHAHQLISNLFKFISKHEFPDNAKAGVNSVLSGESRSTSSNHGSASKLRHDSVLPCRKTQKLYLLRHQVSCLVNSGVLN